MKMAYIRLPILGYFLNDTLNWQMVWGKENYLLNSLHEKLKNKVSLKQIRTVNDLSLPKTNK